MTSEILTLLLTILGIGFTIDSRFTKQIDQQNVQIEKLFNLSQKNAENIRDISYYLKTNDYKLTEIEKDVKYIFDLNGHAANRTIKNESNNKETP